MKTVYRFYQKLKDNALCANEDLSLQDKYPLYALTNNKKLAKEFISQRNMDNFILRKSKMEDEEYVSIANRSASSVLNKYKYVYYDRCNKNKEVDVEIVSTWNEKEIVEAVIEDSVELNEGLSYSAIPFLFNKEYIKALDKLGYVAFWKLYGDTKRFQDILTEEEIDFADDYSFPDLKFDEVAIFINLHGYTMH